MTIEQKAREIAERAFDSSASYPEKRFQAARLGIIEGLEMAAKVAEDWDMDWTTNAGENIQRIAEAIRALIEEQKV